jgi:anti-anti-sigma regulatory factor
MEPVYRHIEVRRRGGVFCVRLTRPHYDETELHELGDELEGLVVDEGCRRLALALGNDTLECVYSMFLAKLIMARRVLLEHEGRMILCEVGPVTRGILDACRLLSYFDIEPNVDAAAAALAK